MNISDDELDRLFRASKPASAERFAPLTAREIAIREGIIRQTFAPSPTRRRRVGWAWGGVTAAVASIAVITLIAVNVLGPTQSAVALTPPPLQYANAQPLDAVVADAQQKLDLSAEVAQQSEVRAIGWGWNIDIAKEHVEVVPQESLFEWSPETGSVSTVIAAESYWADGERPEGVTESPYKPGDVISEVQTNPEDLDIPAGVMALKGASREDLSAALADIGATPDSSSGELLLAIGQLLSYWTLTDEQHATLISMLVDAGGVTVLGESKDRLGRDVTGLRVADENSEFQNTLLISRDTGRIVGMENELTKPMDFIPAGVVGYTLWDVE
ncbi:hypothetical protein [Microbacterium sp. Root553]|uniref:hypothetical protein n=1 Tax=Microbacterium sp. Root553 TaxID=1736556 RepID=UPI0006FD10FD|nr:hypothetical protein [Microbacterium sp. Root553]KQZ23097.1 hypothetical protein ASD43_00965 [Microbacterium sp. Root553]